jgi:hypothetical protein
MTNKNTTNSTICAEHHYPQINTTNAEKIWPLLLATRGKYALNIQCVNRNGHHNTELRHINWHYKTKLIKGLATRTTPNNFDDEMSCYTLFYMERIIADTL